MSKSAQPYKIPFAKESGDLLTYVYRNGDDNVEWRDNYIFEDSLIYVRPELGRSKTNFVMRSLTNNVLYRIRLHHFDSCIRRPNNGVGPIFHGNWTFVKRGCNYSLVPAGENV